MEEMRRHVADCPYCGPEARALGALPNLLDSIDMAAEVPPPALPPSVEEAVLDRFARERIRERRPRRRFALPRIPRLAGVAAAVATVAVIAVVALVGSGEESHAYASAKLGPVGGVQSARAVAWAEDVPAGTRVRLRARGLPSGGRAMYELWCIRSDGRWISGGTFRAGGDGRADAELTAAVRPGDYHTMVVTRHMGGESKHGPALLRGELDY
jgi:hypothetical protein